MKKMTTSVLGKRLIKDFEGLKLNAYLCPAGVATIGWGHTKGVKMGMTITERQAEDYLVEDIGPIERNLNKLGVNFRQEQFDALVSFVFNLGWGNFSHSTLKSKILNDFPDQDIASEFIKWIYAGGKPLPGLKKRRVAEANMFVGYELYYLDRDNNIKKR